jgi:hypothetical protein
MAEAIAIKWKEGQVTNGRKDRRPMAEATAIQWKEGQVTNGRRYRF